MPHKLNFSLSSVNLDIDFFFRVGLSLHESSNALKNKLKSSDKTVCLSYNFMCLQYNVFLIQMKEPGINSFLKTQYTFSKAVWFLEWSCN